MPSIHPIHPSANWFERKYSICSASCSRALDPRRIQRITVSAAIHCASFPTTGYTEVRYDEAQKRVVYEPVSLVGIPSV